MDKNIKKGRKFSSDRLYKPAKWAVLVVTAVVWFLAIATYLDVSNSKTFNGWREYCSEHPVGSDNYSSCIGLGLDQVNNLQNAMRKEFVVGVFLPLFFFGGVGLYRYIFPKGGREQKRLSEKSTRFRRLRIILLGTIVALTLAGLFALLAQQNEAKYKGWEDDFKPDSTTRPMPSPTISQEQQIEKQEIHQYLRRVTPIIEDFVALNQRYINLAKDVENRSIFSMETEALEIEKGYSSVEAKLTVIFPPDRASKSHKKFISGVHNYELALQFASQAIKEGWNEGTRDIYLALMKEYHDKGRADTEPALQELAALEKEDKN